MAPILTTGAGGYPAIGGAAWTPASLPSLVAWYKADSGVYNDAGTTLATNSQTVQQWNDQSGHGYHMSQATAGNRPSFQTAGYNGKQTVLFSQAAATGLVTASGVAISGSPFSCFFVGQMTSGVDNNGRVMGYGTSTVADFSAGGTIFICRTGVTSALQTYRVGGEGQQAISLATNMIVGFISDGANNTPYLSNVAGTPFPDTNTNTTGGYLAIGSQLNAGGALASGAYWNGPISEIVLTNAAMSSGDRASLQTYLSGRW